MEDKEFEEFKNKLDQFSIPTFGPIAFAEIDHFTWYFAEMLGDVETFYQITKYPVLEVIISLLRDLSGQIVYVGKDTLSLLRRWKFKFDKQNKINDEKRKIKNKKYGG